VTLVRRDHGFATDVHRQGWTAAHLMYHGIKSGSDWEKLRRKTVSIAAFRNQLPSLKWRLSLYGDVISSRNRDIQECWPSCPADWDNATQRQLWKEYRCDEMMAAVDNHSRGG